MSSGNPTGVTSILPGGAGVITAGTTPVPMVGTPTLEPFAQGAADATNLYQPNGSGTGYAIQGNLVVLPRSLPNGITAANQAGGGYWVVSNGYATPHAPFTYGIVNVSNAQAGSEIPQIVNVGPAQALCTASTTAIAYGSLLCSDGQGGLTTFQPPAAAPTPTSTTNGTTGASDNKYALVAVSANGTYSALGTAVDVTNGNATLTYLNSITLAWVPVADAVGYIVVRTSAAGTPSSVGVIGYVPAGSNTFTDTGIVADPNTSATQFFQRLAAAATPTVTNGGASGSTTWTYKVSAIAPNGVWGTAESSAGSNTSGVATLTTANYNNITFTLTTGATLYAIDRTAAGTSPTALGIIGYVAVEPGTTPTVAFKDTGLPVIGSYASLVQASPAPTPQPGACLGIALGALAASTTTPALVNVWVGGY